MDIYNAHNIILVMEGCQTVDNPIVPDCNEPLNLCCSVLV
jgi:hypothetical protein